MLIFLAEVEETLEELADYVKKQRWWNRVFGKNNSRPLAEKYSVGGQIAIGGLTGW